MSDIIITARYDRVLLVRLNRPEALNALCDALGEALLAELSVADADPGIGCIVITGNDKAFAAGGDIKEMAAKSQAAVMSTDFGAVWQRIGALRTPKIAAVQGYALGGGCELAMLCDFIIAGDSARFGQPEIKLGIVAGFGGTQRLTKLIGRAKSMEMHLTGRLMDAQEALAAGLVARVTPDAELLDTALATASTIAGYSKQVAGLVREAVHQADELPLSQGLLYERRVFHSLFGTADRAEGMAAFIEKRPARFNGI